jgi:hypothetical protein
LPDWLGCVGHVASRVLVAGWFSTTNPRPLAEAVGRLRRDKTVCYIQFHGVGDDLFAETRTAATLDEFMVQARGG